MIDFSATTFMESMKAKGISEDAIRMIEPGPYRLDGSIPYL